MNPLGIRARVVLAAILPVVVVAMLLAIVFIFVVVSDLDSAHRQRALALARQIAATSEFALFTRNQAALEGVLNASKREADVRALAVLDRSGHLIAHVGNPNLGGAGLPARHDETREVLDDLRRLVVQPIVVSELPEPNLFDQGGTAAGAAPAVLGYVAVEFDRQSLIEGERVLVLVGTLVTLVGLLFGCMLAIRLGRTVSAPILQVVDVVDRFGRGKLDARVPVDSSGSLRALEEGINRMAERIEQHRDELERRVEEATRELRVRKEEAEHANTAKSRFLAAASHDLRQPIHALRLFADSLRDEVSSQPRAAALLERIQSSIETTATMFDALLDISRLEAGVIQTDVHDFPLQSLLRRIETMFTPVALERGLRFSVVASRAWVRSDPGLLDRVLQNLVGNAMKYTVTGGVVVGCRRRQGRIAIEVWDTGPGIAPEHCADIFQEFFQLDNPARDSRRGLGLGLAIVDRIAHLLDHPLRLKSEPGRGSMFAIEVPRGDPASARQQDPGEIALAHRFPGLRVGVVDDDQPIREGMTELLGRWGCVVSVAPSARELLDRLASEGTDIDLLICDYRLGSGESGLQAIADVQRSLRHEVPTLLITGDTAADRLREAHESGYLLLHKPVPPAKLRQVMHHVLNVHQSREPPT